MNTRGLPVHERMGLAVQRGAVLAAVMFWCLFLVLPLLVTAAASLTDTEFPVFPPQGLTLRWFERVIDYAWFLSSLKTSAIVASASTALSLALGLLGARALARPHFRGKSLLELLVMGPLIVPGVVVGFAFFQVVVQLGLTGHALVNMIVAHAVVTVPFTLRSIATVLASVDSRIEEAALSLGATPWQAFWRIGLPAMAPGLLAGGIIAFTFSFNDVTVSAFLIGPNTRSLAVELMSQSEFLPDPTPAAASTLLMLLTLVFFVVIDRTVGLDVFARK